MTKSAKMTKSANAYAILQSHLDVEDAKAGFVHSSARSANIVEAVQKLRHYPRHFPLADPPCVGGHALK